MVVEFRAESEANAEVIYVQSYRDTLRSGSKKTLTPIYSHSFSNLKNIVYFPPPHNSLNC